MRAVEGFGVCSDERRGDCKGEVCWIGGESAWVLNFTFGIWRFWICVNKLYDGSKGKKIEKAKRRVQNVRIPQSHAE